jgi:hypothetical protein
MTIPRRIQQKRLQTRQQSQKSNEWLSNIVHVLLLLLFGLLFLTPSSSSSSSSSTDRQTPSTSPSKVSLSYNNNPIILLLDVDNTLYREEAIAQPDKGGGGIESQIVRNIHNFCARRLHLTSAQANDLHYQYGSTIEGCSDMVQIFENS